MSRRRKTPSLDLWDLEEIDAVVEAAIAGMRQHPGGRAAMSQNEEACGCGQCVDCAAAFMNRPDPASEIVGWCFNCQREVDWEGTDQHHVRLAGPPEDDERWGGCGPVWPGIRVNDQAELERLAPDLLRIEAPGHWVEWVPGRGVLSFMQWLVPEFTAHYRDSDIAPSTSVPPNDETGQAVAQLARAVYKEHGHGLIDWLRIAADPDNHSVNLEEVRAVVAQCRAAGVPVRIERLGGKRWHQPGPFFFDPAGADPAEWPEDLRLQELPEVEP